MRQCHAVNARVSRESALTLTLSHNYSVVVHTFGTSILITCNTKFWTIYKYDIEIEGLVTGNASVVVLSSTFRIKSHPSKIFFNKQQIHCRESIINKYRLKTQVIIFELQCFYTTINGICLFQQIICQKQNLKLLLTLDI